jgi:hypothetical protein
MTDEELISLLKSSPTFQENYSPEEQELYIDKMISLDAPSKQTIAQTLEAEKVELAKIEEEKPNIINGFEIKSEQLYKQAEKQMIKDIETDQQTQDMAKAEQALANI